VEVATIPHGKKTKVTNHRRIRNFGEVFHKKMAAQPTDTFFLPRMLFRRP